MILLAIKLLRKGAYMRVDVYHHFEFKPDTEVLARLNQILSKLGLMENHIMPTLADLQAKAAATLAAVTADTDLDNAVAKVVNDQIATIVDLKAQLAAAGTDPVALQALSDTMDAILSTDTSNAAIVAAAVKAGTPPAPPAA